MKSKLKRKKSTWPCERGRLMKKCVEKPKNGSVLLWLLFFFCHVRGGSLKSLKGGGDLGEDKVDQKKVIK